MERNLEMFRYKMEVLVRPKEPQDGDCSEKPFKVHLTAENELIARRCALEQAWFDGLLVSKFISIKQGERV